MTTEYQRGDTHVYRRVAGEHLLIALHRDRVAPMFAFTPTAAAVWERLERWSTRDDLVEHVLEHFDVSREVAEADVAGFLDQLQTIGAVNVREHAT
jgi:hypothetical protein